MEFTHNPEFVKLALESDFAKSRLSPTVRENRTVGEIFKYVGTTHDLLVYLDYSVVRLNKQNLELNNCKCHSVDMFFEWVRSCDEKEERFDIEEKNRSYFIPFDEREY